MGRQWQALWQSTSEHNLLVKNGIPLGHRGQGQEWAWEQWCVLYQSMSSKEENSRALVAIHRKPR